MSSTYTCDQLTQAFIAFRDSLPVDSERRQTLQKITSLRFDTRTPNLLHLCSSDPSWHPTYRRLTLPTARSLEEVAEDLVLFPPHTEVYGRVPEDVLDFILNLSPEMKEKYCILDQFVSVDANLIVIIGNISDQSENIFYLLANEASKTKDPDAYFIRHFIFSVASQLQEKSKDPGCTSYGLAFDPQMIQAVKAHWTQSPTFKAKVNETLKQYLPYGLTMTQEDIKYLNAQVELVMAGVTSDEKTLARVSALAMNQVGIILVQTLESILPGLCDLDLPSKNEVEAALHVGQ